MLKALQKKGTLVRILLGFIVLLVGGAMVITLVPGTVGPFGDAAGVVATVAGQTITLEQVDRQLRQLDRDGTLQGPLRNFYAQQILDQLIHQHLLSAEARRLGIRVTDEEMNDRIKLLLPTVFPGGTFAGTEQYTAEVRDRLGLTVSEFEELVEQGLLEQKVYRLVTDGITVTAEEVEREFRRRNDRVRLEYVRLSPAELEARVQVPEAELAAFFQRNLTRYQVPERRAIRYILADRNELARQIRISEEDLRAYYNANLERFRVQNRVRVSHILFRTVGKTTDAEIAEVRARAEDVLRRARRGGSFEQLAREFSDDAATRDNGGSLGWIQAGQTVPAFEQAAFSLPVGSISDLIETEYGIHILKIHERELARTRSFEEVRETLRPELVERRLDQRMAEIGDQLAAEVRRSTRRPIEEVAQAVGLEVRETGPFALNEPMNGLGADPLVQPSVFRLREGELSAPIRTDRGYLVFAVREVQPARQGTLADAEIRARVVEDFRRERSVELARTRAEEIARRAGEGASLAAAARALGFSTETTEPFAQTGSAPGLGSGRQFAAAFSMQVGGTGGPVQVGDDWVVYRVAERQEARMEELAAERDSLAEQLLASRREMAYEAFRRSLRQRMTLEGKLEMNQENMRRLLGSA